MPNALIVAHGAPANPAPQEAHLQRLAQEVGALLPGWEVRGATLAAKGALAAALRDMNEVLVYPFFMAEGWFTGTALPRALAEVGADARILPPFGVERDLPILMAQVATQGAILAGIEPRSATLLLAAHGSKISRSSKDSVIAMRKSLLDLTGFREIEVGLIEEPPFLENVAKGLGLGVCLPFFALRAGHVEDDVPQALAAAAFRGPLLPAIGEHPGVAGLIAATLGQHQFCAR
jgi:sirohydrochlorin ferrochelatase